MRMADCHPDRKYYVKGLCKTCASRAEYNRVMADPERREKRRMAKLSYNRTDRCRANRARTSYGISQEQALELVRRTHCDICGVKLTFGQHCDTSKHIDHCHKTGMVRGVLCSACNRALGLTKDDTWRIQSMQDYLAVASAQLAYA
jgi:hypothetical protein